jgi:predicted MFS family arabinose efflux permease
MAVARTVGPAAGSVLIAVFSPATALLIIGLTMWANTVSVGFVRRPAPDKTQDGDFRISRALRVVWHDRQLMALLAGVSAVAAGSEPAITLAPSIARHLDQVGVSPGWITTSFGLGGVLGVIVHPLLASRIRPATQGPAAMVGLAAALVPVAFTRSLTVLTIGLILGGAAMVMASIGFSIALVQRCPRGILGRVMGLWVIAFAGTRPLAGLLLGLSAEYLSLAAAILAAAVVTVVVALVVHVAVRSHR